MPGVAELLTRFKLPTFAAEIVRRKTHAAAALGHALVQRGHSVLFSPTFRLVQELLAAKRDLALPRALQRLDAFEVLILDDIGYVQQSADEVEVLFTLMAERYERRSLVITSNLVFGEWDRIFKNPMTTAAAIDRLVHHSTILEFSAAASAPTRPNSAPSPEQSKQIHDDKLRTTTTRSKGEPGGHLQK
jgi:DNA replication protein DnaC